MVTAPPDPLSDRLIASASPVRPVPSTVTAVVADATLMTLRDEPAGALLNVTFWLDPEFVNPVTPIKDTSTVSASASSTLVSCSFSKFVILLGVYETSLPSDVLLNVKKNVSVPAPPFT